MYFNGEGVQRDYTQAHMWFSLSALKGNTTGIFNKGDITKKMNSNQISQAQEMFKRCLDGDYPD